MGPPRSEPLSDSSARRLRRLADRACDELERSLRHGEPCRAEDLLARFPELAEHRPLALDLIGLEFALRTQLGQAPAAAEFRARFPQWGEDLERRLVIAPPVPTCSSADQVTVRQALSPTNPDNTRTGSGATRRLGHYELLERIGHGGMGDVYRARQCPPLERIVALKVLRTGDEFEVRTFDKEIEVARRLRHPHLLPIYDAGCIDGEYYYTMPLLAGGSLEKRLRLSRPEPRWTVELVEKVARAVHSAHRQGVLHRDLKPANILLDDHDEPLVADFGLAKLLDQSIAQTRTGQMLGSVPYMSPEQANGQGHRATPGSDVWSLGVILHEMLAGQRPFQGSNHSEILRRITHQEPFRLRQLRADLPADLEAICLKCLEKDSAWRYPSALELADDLRRWLDGVPLPQPPRSLADRLRRAANRHLNVKSGTVVLLGCLLLLALFAVMPPRLPTTPPSEVNRNILPRDAARPGQPLDLLAPGGRLLGSRIELGGVEGKLIEAPGRPCSVTTPTHLLLELSPPDPKRRGFRLAVKLRHADVSDDGFTGLYFGRSSWRSGRGVGHAFASIHFAEPGLGGVGDLNPPEAGHGPRAMLDVRFAFEEPNVRPRISSAGLPWFLLLQPAPVKRSPGPWRTFILQVTPQDARVSCDGVNGQPAPANELKKMFSFLQRKLPQLRQNGIDPPFAPAGGLGIYVNRGSIDIQSVTFELLAP